jgi:acetolactate synthase-1/2/3 large subunit
MSQIRVADYIFRTLADRGVTRLFLVTGGGAMHLNDAIGRETRIQYICNHHEQASAIAAEGYARITNRIGVLNVTTGPGAINALNGVFGAFTDSIPLLVISGQVKRETCMAFNEVPGLRQLGDQEVDIVAMAKPVTKYAVLIREPETIRYHLEKALHLTTSGRPGPCWIDVPVDIQAAMIDPEVCAGYDPNEDDLLWDLKAIRKSAVETVNHLLAAERPVLLAGTGVRLAGAEDLFLKLTEKLQIPVSTAWTHDLISSDHPLFCGRQGTIGNRSGNFTVQNADCVLILGSRMCIRQVSFNWGAFAREAFTIQVDIDQAELSKPTFRAQMPVHADVRTFLEMMLEEIPDSLTVPQAHTSWLGWCRERVTKYPNVLDKHRTAPAGTINPYYLVELVFEASRTGDIFACGDATACIVPFQAGHLKKGQRLFSNSGCASMGYDLPAAIGAATAAREKGEGNRVICFAGDGSIQMNIQELATLAYHRFPIKLFILANGGYLSIRSTQDNFFKLRVGAGPDSGVGFPDFVQVAKGYGLKAELLDTARAKEHLAEIFSDNEPKVILVSLDQEQAFEPKTSSKRLPDGRMITAPLEDMAPFLERGEFLSNMLINPVSE